MSRSSPIPRVPFLLRSRFFSPPLPPSAWRKCGGPERFLFGTLCRRRVATAARPAPLPSPLLSLFFLLLLFCGGFFYSPRRSSPSFPGCRSARDRGESAAARPLAGGGSAPLRGLCALPPPRSGLSAPGAAPGEAVRRESSAMEAPGLGRDPPEPGSEASPPAEASPAGAAGGSEDARLRPGAKRVTFPCDEDIVSGSEELKDPWRHAQNVTVEEIVTAYKQACQKLNCKQIPKLLRQIQEFKDLAPRIDCLDLKGEKLDYKACEALEEIFKRVQFKTVDLEQTSLDEDVSGRELSRLLVPVPQQTRSSGRLCSVLRSSWALPSFLGAVLCHWAPSLRPHALT
ncbi:uncharacterized protein LOC142365379 [Opisthocomus hoazin]|uniref:uncharacterized protein LOC142365379 n=1 Tax=Opisthocomus hoazin TaxID=30419 RepID=UPI003F53D4C6